ncbi:MAG: energy transducer TonB, partial [Bdellovibrio sp.]
TDQLSLFDFKMADKDFAGEASQSSNALDYHTWMLAHREPEADKTGKFMTVSAFVHAVLIAGAALLTVPLVEKAQVETITIEVEGSSPAPKIAPVALREVTPQQALIKEDLPEMAAAAPAKATAATSKPVRAQSHSAKSAAAVSSSAATAVSPAAKSGPQSVAAKTTLQAVPATIDDIDAPELDEGELATAAVAAQSPAHFNDDLDEDFASVDQAQKAALARESHSIKAMADALESEQDENLNALSDLNQVESQKLAQAQAALKEKNAKAVSAALAAEQDAANKAAAARAAQQAAAQQAAGSGQGHQGSGAGAEGLPHGIRSLDQLRQMPGNPRPYYDRQERLRGDQGAVAFIAYISKDGYPSKFRMLKSTGFRNLDSKTLTALKKWRFYPGQEGWVELPFRWDLKGGAQEDGGLLRRSVGQR